MRVLGDESAPAIYGIRSDYDPDVTLDLVIDGSGGDVCITLHSRDGKIDFQLSGPGGGSLNKRLVSSLREWVRSVFVLLKTEGE